MISTVLLVIVSVIAVALAVMLRNALKREQMLLKSVEDYEQYFKDIQVGLNFVLSEIKTVDLRGSFESDDEVGIVFKAIVNMISSLQVFLTEEVDAETES